MFLYKKWNRNDNNGIVTLDLILFCSKNYALPLPRSAHHRSERGRGVDGALEAPFGTAHSATALRVLSPAPLLSLYDDGIIFTRDRNHVRW